MPASILALLKELPKPSAVHGRRRLLVKIVVASFGMRPRTSRSALCRGMIASRRWLLLPVVRTIASSSTCYQATRIRSLSRKPVWQARSTALATSAEQVLLMCVTSASVQIISERSLLYKCLMPSQGLPAILPGSRPFKNLNAHV